jgi:chromosome segregation ATPase
MTHRETITTLVEQRISEAKTSLDEQFADQRREVFALSECLERLEQQQQGIISQEQVAQKAWLAYQKQVETQEQQLQTLTTMLQEEQAARQSLAKLFTRQHEQLQVVCRELASLKTKCVETKE